MANSIFVIHPYWWWGTWVFDDESKGLEKEPFVSGANILIDSLVTDIPDARKGFRLLFSDSPFETAESETPSHIASHKTDANGQKPSTTGKPTGEQAKSETSETLENKGQIQPLTTSDKNGQRSALAGATGLEATPFCNFAQ